MTTKRLFKHIYHSGFARRLLSGLLAFLVPTILVLFRPPTASAEWFDDNYGYRQKVSYTHNAHLTSDRRIPLTVDTASLIFAIIRFGSFPTSL